MKIILLQDIQHLGHKSEVKNVSDGYARNFLFPRNLARPATDTAIKMIAVEKAHEEQEKSAKYQKYKALAEKLKSLILKFKVKLGAKGRTFGSVTAIKIRDALKKQRIGIEKEWILLEESIKTAGEHQVKIKFPHDFKGEIKVVVEADK